MTLVQAVQEAGTKLGTQGVSATLDGFYDEALLGATENDRFWSMDRYEAYYLGLQHEQKCAAWDGRRVAQSNVDRSNAHQHGLGDSPEFLGTPWYYRRPYVRKQLAASIVDRYTGLLFGETRVPRIAAAAPKDQPFVDALLKLTAWWDRWAGARSLGGATGSVAVGVQVVDGTPLVDVVNAKHCTPHWKGDPSLSVLESIEIRFKRPTWDKVQQRDGITGRARTVWKQGWEWYWRVVTEQADVVLTAPEKSGGNGEGLDWTVDSAHAHGLGFCPFVWVRNSSDSDCTDDDGRSDVAEQLDNFDALDALLSDAFKGTHYNADPTLILKLAQQLNDVKTGSDSALNVGPDGDAKLLELSGTAAKAALDLYRGVRDSILEDTHCVLDEGEASGRSATELVKRTEAMFERADVLRRRYGDAMERLFEMLLRILRALNYAGLPEAFAKLARPGVDDVTVEWPPYVQMSATEKAAMAQSIGQSVAAGVLSKQTACEIIAPLYGKDPVEEWKRLQAEEESKAARYGALLGETGGALGQPPGKKPGDGEEDDREDPDDDKEAGGKDGDPDEDDDTPDDTDA